MNRKALIYTIGFYLWLCLILVVSSIPEIGSNKDIPLGTDKIAHLTEYLVLGILFILMKKSRNKPITRVDYCLLAFPIPFLEELHQIWIPGRQFSVWDYIADWSGITLAFLINLLINSRRRKPKL